MRSTYHSKSWIITIDQLFVCFFDLHYRYNNKIVITLIIYYVKFVHIFQIKILLNL